MQKIYIIESVPAIAQKFRNKLCEIFDIRICKDYENSLDEIRLFQPDLLIVDMTAPSSIIQKIPECVYLTGMKTKMIVSASYTSGTLEKRLFAYGCTALISRPVTVEYLMKLAVQTLLENDVSEVGETRRVANEILQFIGLRVELQGYKCLLEAVVYAVHNPECMITCEIYPAVARILKSNSNQVERIIRICLDKSWEIRDDRIWNLYFPKDSDGKTLHVSNGVFIKRIAHAVSNVQYPEGVKIAK